MPTLSKNNGLDAAVNEAVRTAAAHQQAGRLQEAEILYRRVLAKEPEHREALHLLGVLAIQAGRPEWAVKLLGRITNRTPEDAAAWSDLGNALRASERFEEAIAALQRAIQLEPHRAEGYDDLGRALLDAARLDEAEGAFAKSIELAPELAEAHGGLARSWMSRGRIDLALESYRTAVRLAPADAKLCSNLALAASYAADEGSALAEAVEWDRKHGQPLKSHIRPHDNERSPKRRLRIGYISADFRKHVAGDNLRPLLRAHDRDTFTIFCYSNVTRTDAWTDEFRQATDGWREIAGISDQDAAELIRADGIDILIDLSLHTAGNRLPVFARKPAPVQASYLGYCGTTGLEAMDYRLSDWFLDPPETDLGGYTEATVRLPRTYWCYQPAGPTPAAGPLPSAKNGFVTFGCMNNFAKVSFAALDLWAEILRAVPRSRLHLHAPEGNCREAVRERFARLDLAGDRLEFAAMNPWPRYVEAWQQIDVALDPFPFGGGITTCDALWMGAPVVSLSGQRAVGRGGRSILSNIGLSELVAETPQQYLEIAVALAVDQTRLAGLRAGLRERMEHSPLRDAKGFAREIEAAYREMWRKWCEAGED